MKSLIRRKIKEQALYLDSEKLLTITKERRKRNQW
jgi:hypothetical protein